MFETLQMAPPDAILGLTEAFKKDSHPQKINLSVGVYQDANGKTPILSVVREAEKRLLAEETSKSYLGIDGLPEYARHVRELLFGANHEIVTSQRAVTAQTPGGTGALRVAADFLQQKLGTKRIWCSQPDLGQSPQRISSGRCGSAGISLHRCLRHGARFRCHDVGPGQDPRG